MACAPVWFHWLLKENLDTCGEGPDQNECDGNYFPARILSKHAFISELEDKFVQEHKALVRMTKQTLKFLFGFNHWVPHAVLLICDVCSRGLFI